ncbi:MAG: protein kinase [Victivallales bacterium]|nr:protein kinase [Victivallales bacterium]
MSSPTTQLYGLTVLEKCGRGAFGEVFYCQEATGKKVALKVVSKMAIGTSWERELRGITNYRRLLENTPGLLQIYYVGEDNDSFFYTMEPADAVSGQDHYCPDTLAVRLEHGPLLQEEVIPTLRAILEAIAALHTAGFAHRDIKPDNILFVNGAPKLADLGLLSTLSATATQLAGTLDFLPPETISGETSTTSRETSQQNDLYAFGKLIYCCITGNPASAFPSMPPEMPLTQFNKHFCRLALHLCDKEPTCRLRHVAAVKKEFERTVRLCNNGENLKDALRYHVLHLGRSLRSLAVRNARRWQKHPIGLSIATAVVLAIGIAVGILTTRPDTEAERIAKVIDTEKKRQETASSSHRTFTFYKGRYTLSIPVTWQAFDHDTLLKSMGALRNQYKTVYGAFIPDHPEGETPNSIFMAMVFPMTKKQIETLKAEGEAKLVGTLQEHLPANLEFVCIRHFFNPRKQLDTVLYTALEHPDRGVMVFIYPMEDHCMALLMSIPDPFFSRDSPKFGALLDSLTVNNPGKKSD